MIAGRSNSFRLLHVMTVPMSLMFLRGQVGFMKRFGICIAGVSAPGRELEAFGEEEGVEIYPVDMTRRITPVRDLASLSNLIRVIRDFRPDIVHGHTPKAGLLSMLAARLTGVRVRIYHMRGLPFVRMSGVARWLMVTAERFTCLLASDIICVSRTLRDAAVEARLAPASKLRVLGNGSGNGVDARTRFNPKLLPAGTRRTRRRELGIPDDAVVVGFVGRLVRDKGIVELVQAWMALRDEYPNAHLVLVGPFESRDAVDPDTLTVMNLDSRIHLVGEVANTASMYACMDLVVLPSYREGFPNVPLEAAAMRLPVVATRIPGCVDAVADDRTGTLVESGDVDQLTNAIRRYLDSRELREAHGGAGRERALREFNPEVIWTAIYERYRTLLRGGNAGPKGIAESMAVQAPARSPTATLPIGSVHEPITPNGSS